MKKLITIIVFFIFNFTHAQVTNDACANAITLTPSPTCSPVSGTLLNATTSTATNSCGGNRDVFYKFTATAATATLNVAGSSSLDLVVSVLNACNAATSLYCEDRFANGGVEVVNMTNLVIGSVYYIKVQAFSIYAPGTYTFTICVISSNASIPANDECANAITLNTSTTCSPVSGTLFNASTSPITNSCSGNSDVYYKFVATDNSAKITVAGSAGLDAVVAVFNSCNAATSLYCADSYGSGGTEIVNMTNLVIGATYYIKVQDFASSLPTGYTFTICVQSDYAVIPSNDNCLNSINLIPSPSCNSTSGTLLNATNSSISSSCVGNKDVFYSFEATESTATVSVVPSVGMNVSIGVFESCSGAAVSCADDGAIGSTETILLSNLVVGNMYIVQVQNSGSTIPSTTNFDICIIGATPPPPINDECADAITIYPSTNYTPITGSVKSATTSTITGSCTGNSDVFYAFTAVAKTATITVVGSSGLDPVVGLFKTCGSSNMDCADFDYNAGGTEILTPANLIIGSTYYIKVLDYSSSLPATFSFTVAVQSTAVTTDTDASAHIQQISLFPNPAQDVLNVEHIQTKTLIELVDLRGRVLFTREISSDTQIDLSEYTAGVYILKLSVDGVVENRRVVLSR